MSETKKINALDYIVVLVITLVPAVVYFSGSVKGGVVLGLPILSAVLTGVYLVKRSSAGGVGMVGYIMLWLMVHVVLSIVVVIATMAFAKRWG